MLVLPVPKAATQIKSKSHYKNFEKLKEGGMFSTDPGASWRAGSAELTQPPGSSGSWI